MKNNLIFLPQFSHGQIVQHCKFSYRAVIIRVDIKFKECDDWYEMMALGRPSKDLPWYHLLVDKKHYSTYVAQEHLKVVNESQPIEHPCLEEYFDSFNDGRHIRLSVNEPSDIALI